MAFFKKPAKKTAAKKSVAKNSVGNNSVAKNSVAKKGETFQAPKSAAQTRLEKEFPKSRQERYYQLANAVPADGVKSIGEVLYNLIRIALQKGKLDKGGKEYRRLPSEEREVYDIIASVIHERFSSNPELIVAMTNKASSPLDKED